MKGGQGSGKDQQGATLDEHPKGDSVAQGPNNGKPESYSKKPADTGHKAPKKGSDGGKHGGKGKGNAKPDL